MPSKPAYHPSFWVANGTELFERMAFYGNQAVMTIFLGETLAFSKETTSQLVGLAGTVVYGMPILAGTLADKMGFRRALTLAYLILTTGYFLLGSLRSSFVQGLGLGSSLAWLVAGMLVISGAGAGFVKPVVTGTVSRTTSEATRSTGFSVYYMLVNVGGLVGPLIANLVRLHWGIQHVFQVGAGICALMVVVTLAAFREPAPGPGEQQGKPLAAALLDLLRVFRNWRFIFFLTVFSVFWMMFFQFYIAMPMYIRTYVDPQANTDLVLMVGPGCVVALQVLVNRIWRKVSPTKVILVGGMIASCSMLLVGVAPSMWAVVAALVVFSLGEMTQAPRFYEYVSLLAPPGQTGLFMGYSFAPIALGSFLAGQVGGRLVKYFGEQLHRPALMWTVLFLFGIAACVLMAAFNRFAGTASRPSGQEAAR